MSSDIVDRLRNVCNDLAEEAADEIVKLRRAKKRLIREQRKAVERERRYLGL